MLQGPQKTLGYSSTTSSARRVLAGCSQGACYGKNLKHGEDHGSPRGCGVHGAEPGQIVWWAMHVAALQEKQTWTASWQNKVADAHENATRQTGCPCEEGEGHGKMEKRKKKLSHRQGEKRLSTRAPLLSAGASELELFCLVDPKMRLDL